MYVFKQNYSSYNDFYSIMCVRSDPSLYYTDWQVEETLSKSESGLVQIKILTVSITSGAQSQKSGLWEKSEVGSSEWIRNSISSSNLPESLYSQGSLSKDKEAHKRSDAVL